MLRPGLFSIALLLLSGACFADWPQFRGPQGNGHSNVKDVPLRWDATNNVAWKTAVPGRGWSSPVIGADRLYLTAAIPDGPEKLSLSALAFDTATGKLLWQTPIFTQGPDSPAIHRKNSHASPTPILHGDRLIVHFGHRGTAALNLDGEVQWRSSELFYQPKHGNGGSPIIVGDRLIFTCDGAEAPFVAALELGTGKVAWRTPRQVETSRYFSFCTPTAVEGPDGTQVIAPGSGLIAGYSPEDGRELWRVRHPGYSVIPKPVVGHGLVFVGTGYDSPAAMAIRPQGKGDVTDSQVAWNLRRGAGHTPSFLLVGNELYLLADNGVLTCVDARTGEVHYQERACGQSSASPVFAAGRIYLLDEQGLGVVLAPGRRFEKVAENPIGERTLASYGVTEGTLYIRSEENLFRIGARP